MAYAAMGDFTKAAIVQGDVAGLRAEPHPWTLHRLDRYEKGLPAERPWEPGERRK